MSVVVDLPREEIDHSRSRDDITQSLTAGGKAVGERMALGLTSASLEQETRFSYRKLAWPGGACVQPDIEVSLRLKNPKVEIANELDKESCRYRTVLFHELMHVEVYKTVLEQTRDTIAREFRARYSKERPVVLDNLAQANEWRQQEHGEWLQSLISRQFQRVSTRQTAIDSHAEYMRLTLACQTEPLSSLRR